MGLSPHFSMQEVMRSAKASEKGIDNTVPLAFQRNVGRTAEFMECVRALCGGDPIRITSWFRCPPLNEAVGGSIKSAHMKVLGIDSKHTVLTLEEYFAQVAASTLPFDQLIIEGVVSGAQWLHIGLSEKEPRREIMRAWGDTLGGPMNYTRVAEG